MMSFETLGKNPNRSNNHNDNPSAKQWIVGGDLKEQLERDKQRQAEIIANQAKTEINKGTGLSETQGDVAESLAVPLMAVVPTSPIALFTTASVVAEGSPYDKKNQKRAA